MRNNNLFGKPKKMFYIYIKEFIWSGVYVAPKPTGKKKWFQHYCYDIDVE